MRPFERKAAWAAVRNSLLIVSAIHILVLLRSIQPGQFRLSDLFMRNRGQLLRWLAWSLAAPGIGLLARYFAARRLKWFQAFGLLLSGGIISLSFARSTSSTRSILRPTGWWPGAEVRAEC